MERWERAEQARRSLDGRFKSGSVEHLRARPRAGWIRAIRGALGMSQEALAHRLGISQPAVRKLELSETKGAITIGKLSEVAAALECTLVYALVPNSTLEDTVLQQARRVVARDLGYVGTTMALEDQSVSDEQVVAASSRHLDAATKRGDLWRGD
jgi:predicted DNA-binding mobile mystery protein A